MSVSRRHFLQSTSIVSATIAASGVSSFPKNGAADSESTISASSHSFGPRATKVIFLAEEESQRLNVDYVGSEHLLLALANEAESSRSSWMDELALTLDDLRCVTSHLIPPRRQRAAFGEKYYSENLKQILEKAVLITAELAHEFVEPEHLLLGIIETLSTTAGDVLNEMWFERGACRQAALASLQSRNPCANWS